MNLRHLFAAAMLTTALVALPLATAARADDGHGSADQHVIKHVVVIFQENVSFDHYFGTYPNATNPSGEPVFHAKSGTPTVDGLTDYLLSHNPNSANPFRLDRSQALTCDQGHSYTAEQKAYDAGAVDKFVQSTGNGGGGCDSTQVMGYYDGNTVTAMWNYAQNYAMSDNSFNTTYGPSTPGALNLISGQTHGATPAVLAGAVNNGTVFSDRDPAFDDCSSGTKISMTGPNVGDLLNAKHLTWGWFEGGFAPTGANNGVAVCGAAHTNIGNASVTDYIPHHQPFQYYQQTSNPHHLPPTSVAAIGYTDQANHQYDIKDFWNAVDAGNMPVVSYLKAPAFQDGHAGYSDPLDEQNFLVSTINRLQQTPEWQSTAVIINYDDSDGWYDHVMPPLVNGSDDPTADALTGTGTCGTAGQGSAQDRCGYGPRLPLLVISPFAKSNYVDHGITDQSSVLRFIEDTFGLGRIGNDSFDAKAGPLDGMFDFSPQHHGRRLILDASTGQVVTTSADNGDSGND